MPDDNLTETQMEKLAEAFDTLSKSKDPDGTNLFGCSDSGHTDISDVLIGHPLANAVALILRDGEWVVIEPN